MHPALWPENTILDQSDSPVAQFYIDQVSSLLPIGLLILIKLSEIGVGTEVQFLATQFAATTPSRVLGLVT